MISSLSVVDFSVYHIGDRLKSVILIKFPIGAGIRNFHHFEVTILDVHAFKSHIINESFVSAFNRPFFVKGGDVIESFKPLGEAETAILLVQYDFNLIISFHLVIILYHTSN